MSFDLTGPAGVVDLAEIMLSDSLAAVPEPPESADQVNVGLVRADRPDRPIIRGTVRTGTDHLVWVSIGPPDAEAVHGDREPIDVSSVHDGDVLTVLIFPDQALTVPSAPYWGSFVMGPDRPLRVLRPAERPEVPPERRDTRLYFPVRTPAQPGGHDVRILVYHQNVLLQARRLTLPVSRAGARLSVRTTYTLVRSPTAASVRELSPRRLSLYVNQSDTGSHQLCFSAQDGAEIRRARLTLDPDEVTGLFGPVRRGLRMASWQSANAWNPQYPYRYGLRDSGRFAADFSQLEQDLFRLAKSGYEAWNTLTLGYLIDEPDEQDRDRRSPAERQEDWQRLMRPPGIIQVAPAHGSKLVPPLAGLYDLDFDNECSLSEFRLCPTAATLLQAGGDLATLECFANGCSQTEGTTVCPSGFWGLRHEIAVPPSLGQAAETTFRTVAGPRTALVGTTPEDVLAGVTAHADKVQESFEPDSSQHVWSRKAWLEAASQAGQRYGVLYFLCHGGENPETGSTVIILDKPGQPGIGAATLKKVPLDHHPLVVLNACETAALEPDKVTNLVQGFMLRGASAVIGTEIMIFPSLAYAFGVQFIDAFVTRQASLGAAIRQARLSLLSQWNPLGLAYVGYGLPELTLIAAAAAQAAA